MDADKDGIIGKNDLRAAFDSVGRLATDKEIEEMLNEAPAPINFTQLLNLFAVRMSGSGNAQLCLRKLVKLLKTERRN
jgi:Ca2+-binding EF-hand superfamily protein